MKFRLHRYHMYLIVKQLFLQFTTENFQHYAITKYFYELRREEKLIKTNRSE